MMSQSIAFKHPPVDEVVVSTYFNPPLSDLRSEHIGLFWGKIREDFPVVSQQPPVMSQQSPVEVVQSINADEPFPMPRYWIVSEDETELIQIQKSAFMFNWRRRDDEYPRFHRSIKPAFDGYYGLFSEFIRTEINMTEPLIDLCELTYINVLEPCEYWTGPQDTKKVLPAFRSWRRTAILQSLQGLSATTGTGCRTICTLISAYATASEFSNRTSQFWYSKSRQVVALVKLQSREWTHGLSALMTVSSDAS